MRYCYIVNLYFGERRSFPMEYEKDNLLFLKRHLHQLKILKHDISLAVFVINKTKASSEIEKKAQELIIEFKKIETDIVLRDNVNGSYGGWEEGLKKHSKEFDYAFLIEDDHVPVADNFEKKFQEYLGQEKKFYACQFWDETGQFYLGRPHAAISNGLIDCAVFRTKGRFKLEQPMRVGRISRKYYHLLERNQGEFLNDFCDDGWRVVGLHDKYKSIFVSADSTIIAHGNKDGEELIRPIYYENMRRNDIV
jgi:hypothetical protein